MGPTLCVSPDGSAKVARDRAGEEEGDKEMSSYRSLKVVKVLVVTLAATCVLAGKASAQSYLSGSFTLTHEVRWQGTALPAGDYTITMNSIQQPALVRDAKGKGVVLAMAKVIAGAAADAPTSLFVTQQGDVRVVRSFNWKERGVTFVYAPLKGAEREALARLDAVEAVPVRMASK